MSSIPQMHDQIEAIFLGTLNNLAVELTEKYPSVHFNVFSHSIGAATRYKGWSLGIEATLSDIAKAETDSLVLTIDLCHLDTAPKIMAEVSWSKDGTEVSLSEGWESNNDWPIVNEEVIDRLRSEMPSMIHIFKEYIERGKPSDGNIKTTTLREKI